MDGIKIIENFLSNDELIYLNSLCNNFIETTKFSIKSNHNSYIRKMLDAKTDLLEYQTKVKIHLGSEYEFDGLWINKINANTNQNDDFHKDDSDLSIVTYLNEDFEGGEFQYIFDNEKIKIKPIINLSVIMNRTISHRVLNVTSGERFSLISFYKKPLKKTKTLL
jgi:predicted 2-oxoglutarate/Fe(II)-dependent dioxygenase YbiX